MASSDSRWMNITGLTIGTIALKDAMAHSGGADSQIVESNSEGDTHAAHFAQGVALSRRATFRVFDRAGANSLLTSRLGQGCALSYTIPVATESSTGSNLAGAATSPNAVVESISFDDAKDTQTVAEIVIRFKSPDGVSFGLVES